MSERKLRPGQLFGAYLAFYGVERFLIEFVRAKSDRIILGMSTSQVASLILLGIAGYLWNRKSDERPTVASRPGPGVGASEAGLARPVKRGP